MATARIGHFADVHHPDPPTNTFQSDLAYLAEKDPDRLIWGGDQIIGEEPRIPHSPASDIHDFWQDVRDTVDSDLMDRSYAVWGNHDFPEEHWIRESAEYLDRSHLQTPMRVEPADGVSVFLINTQGPAIVQGGGDSVAQDYCYVPYHELEWLDRELRKAEADGDVRIVIGHAPISFATRRELQCHHPDAPWSDQREAYLGSNQSYEVPQNFETVRDVIDSHTPVVYLCGHDYHGPGWGGSAEFSENLDGLHHVWQDHYFTDRASTFSYVDVDTAEGRVVYRTVNSVDHPNGSPHDEQAILDITPSW